MSDLIVYTSNDGRTRLDLRVEAHSVWLTQMEIAELFQTSKQNISLHARNIFSDNELSEDSVVKESLTTAADGKIYHVDHYNPEKCPLTFPPSRTAGTDATRPGWSSTARTAIP